ETISEANRIGVHCTWNPARFRRQHSSRDGNEHEPGRLLSRLSPLASWAAICPGNHESAGKRRSGKTRQGNRWLKGMLTQTGWAAAGKKNSLFLARYQRIKLRRGGQRAVIAIAHAQLIAIYWALRNDSPYPE